MLSLGGLMVSNRILGLTSGQLVEAMHVPIGSASLHRMAQAFQIADCECFVDAFQPF